MIPNAPAPSADEMAADALPSTEALSNIDALVARLVAATEVVAICEQGLKDAKAALAVIEEKELPDAMLAANMLRIETAEGRQVSLGTEYHANISKGRADKAHDWLRENGHGGLIRTKFQTDFSTGEDEEVASLKKLLLEQGVEFSVEDKVHGSTLKAWVKRLSESETEFPRELFGVYEQRVAKVK